RRPRALHVLHSYLAARDPRWVRKSAALTAQDLMTARVVTARPDEDLGTAARRMLERDVKRLPVVQDGWLVGIVSRHDLLRYFERSDRDIQVDVTALLSDPLAASEAQDLTCRVVDGVVSLDGDVRFESDKRVLAAMVARIPG